MLSFLWFQLICCTHTYKPFHFIPWYAEYLILSSLWWMFDYRHEHMNYLACICSCTILPLCIYFYLVHFIYIHFLFLSCTSFYEWSRSKYFSLTENFLQFSLWIFCIMNLFGPCSVHCGNSQSSNTLLTIVSRYLFIQWIHQINLHVKQINLILIKKKLLKFYSFPEKKKSSK